MRDIATKADETTTLSAAEWNSSQEEAENFVTGTNIVLDSGDSSQMTKAGTLYGSLADFYTESGAADVYVLNTQNQFSGPPGLENGLRARFTIGNANTGASTVALPGLGAVDLKKVGGTTVLASGDLPAGDIAEIVYVAAQSAFTLVALESAGISGGGGTAFTTVMGQSQPTADIGSLVAKASPVNTDLFVIEESGGTFKKLDFDGLNAAITGGIPSEFAAGTKMLFGSTTAPSGWTKVTLSNHNNAGIRLVTGTASTSGTDNWDAVMGTARPVTIASEGATGTISVNSASLSGTVGSVALNDSQIPSHTHDVGLGTESADWGVSRNGNGVFASNASTRNLDTGNNDGDYFPATGATGSGSSHNHSLSIPSHNHTSSFTPTNHAHTGSTVNLDVKTVDMIAATKD